MFVHEASVLWQSSVPLAHSSISMERRIPLYTVMTRFGVLLRISASSLTITSGHVSHYHEFVLSSYRPLIFFEDISLIIDVFEQNNSFHYGTLISIKAPIKNTFEEKRVALEGALNRIVAG